MFYFIISLVLNLSIVKNYKSNGQTHDWGQMKSIATISENSFPCCDWIEELMEYNRERDLSTQILSAYQFRRDIILLNFSDK